MECVLKSQVHLVSNWAFSVTWASSFRTRYDKHISTKEKGEGQRF